MIARGVHARFLPRLYASSFCMDGGFFLISAAIPFKVLAVGGGPVALGLVPALGALTYIVFTQLAGRWSDRVGRTWLCLAGNLILIVFAILAYRVQDLVMLLAIMPLMGIGKALYWPVVQSAIGDRSGPGELERNIGLFNVAWSSGKMIGFLAGGLLMALTDFRTTFQAGAGLVALAFLALPRGREPARQVGHSDLSAKAAGEVAADSVPDDLRRTFRRMAWLANMAAFGAVGILGSHLPKWFEQLSWREERFGIFLALIFLVQTVIFVLLTGRIRFTYSLGRLLWPQIIAAVVLGLLPWLRHYAGWLLLAPWLGIMGGVCYAASIFYSLHATTSRGKFAGTHESLIGLGGFLPPLLGGLLASWSGWLGAPYVFGAGVIFALVAVQMALWKRLPGNALRTSGSG